MSYEDLLDRLAKRVPKKRDSEQSQMAYDIKRVLYKLKRKNNSSKNLKSARGGLSSMGARGVYVKPNDIYHRRVVVKASYVQSSNKNARKRIRHHFNYAGENKLDERERKIELYDSGDKEIDIKAKIDDFEKAPHIFTVIISPEDGDKLDLKEFVQDFIKVVEKDLKTKLDWVAGNHYDTNDPHVHLLIKGLDEEGKTLLMRRDYIANGLRYRAGQVATNKLGLRDINTIIRSIELKINNTKPCELDRIVIDNSVDGKINLRACSYEQLKDLPRRLYEQRLEFLGSKALCRKLDDGVWQLKPKLLEELKKLDGVRATIEALSLSRIINPKDVEILSATKLIAKEIKGHVIERCLVEGSDKEALLIKAKDKKYVYVELEKYSEKSPARVGDFVKVQGTKPFLGPKISDHTIWAQSQTNNGVYSAKAHIEALQNDKLRSLPPGVSAEDYVNVHLKRLEVFSRKNLVEKLADSRFKIPSNYLESLKIESLKSRSEFTPHIKVVRLSGLKNQGPAQSLRQSL